MLQYLIQCLIYIHNNVNGFVHISMFILGRRFHHKTSGNGNDFIGLTFIVAKSGSQGLCSETVQECFTDFFICLVSYISELLRTGR